MVTTIQFTAIPKLTAEAIHSQAYAVAGFGFGLLLTFIFQAAGLFTAMIGYIIINVGRSVFSFARAVWRAG